MIKLAFMGFRHGHILGVYQAARKHPDVKIVAAGEEDARTRAELTVAGKVQFTHQRYADLLDGVEYDAVAVGDYYSRRGEILIAALQRGKHVISDKPICTRLTELDQIESLVRQKGLKIGCQLDLRGSGNYLRVRELVRSGAIGAVHGITIGGQHPLNLGVRPAWYFEPGKHGGTINDIGIHAFDLIPWVTGRNWAEIGAARSWNALAKPYPHFHDAAQFMLRLDNQGGVLGDVSYFMPNSMGYSLPQYWRFTLYGEQGVIETCSTLPGVSLAKNGRKAPETLPAIPGLPEGNFQSWLREIGGETKGLTLTTADVLRASRVALMVQQAADENRTQVALPG